MKKIAIIFLLLLQIVSQRVRSQNMSYHWLPANIVSQIQEKFHPIKYSGSKAEFSNHYKALIGLEEEKLDRVVIYDSSGVLCEEQIILKPDMIPNGITNLLTKNFPTCKIIAASSIEVVKGEKYFLAAIDSSHETIFVKCYQSGKEHLIKRLSGDYQKEVIARFGNKIHPFKSSFWFRYIDGDSEFEYVVSSDSFKRITVCFDKEGAWVKTKIWISSDKFPNPVKKTLEQNYAGKKVSVAKHIIHANNTEDYQVLFRSENGYNTLIQLTPDGVVTRSYSYIDSWHSDVINTVPVQK